MYEDKLKKELFEKICKYDEIIKAMSKIEESDLSIPELFDTNDEYAGFCVQSMDLQDELNELMLDTKYAPLTMLTSSQIGKLDFFEESSNLDFEQNIEKHLDLRLLKLKEEMKIRLKQVKTLRLSASVHQHIYNLYNQIIRCYVYGAFEASCVLCRAIAESIAKRFIEHKGHGDLLVDKNKHLKTMSIQEILNKKLSISIELIGIYSKITNKADKILHEKSGKVEEKDALKAIQLLQSFIKRFPKTL